MYLWSFCMLLFNVIFLIKCFVLLMLHATFTNVSFIVLREKNHWWWKQGYRVNTTWPGSTHCTLYEIMLFRISHYIESTIDHFMQNTMKLLYMFPINCSTFWCFNNMRIICLLCNFKIIIWFLTRFKYLQIMRKLEII
jgi:hypothetical protein